ncbi:MAG: hypothetical protein QX197_10655 [Methylococcaceae bacterium]
MKSIFILFYLLIYTLPVFAELHLQHQSVVSDSEESFSRRIYSYDFDVSSKGIIHAVYAKPVVGQDRAQIIYMSKSIGGEWPAENKRIILEEAGLINSISTWLIYDNNTNRVHISYIVKRAYIDKNNFTHASGLVYQTITDGNVAAKINVSSGEFYTKMQLNKDGSPLFAREYEDFLNSNGSVRSPPFPKALRIQIPNGKDSWTDREYLLKLPAEQDYRLSNFVYDAKKNRFHITYGNKNAVILRNTYPTTNPPVTSESKPVFFPPSAGHQLKYAYSDDLNTWTVSTIDASGNISENEFWGDLVVDSKGTPYSSHYQYKTDLKGIQEGSTGVFGIYKDGQWQIATIAGNTRGASEPRAGAAAKLTIDAAGGFHGVWDNSPDAPIDSESAKGTTMYHYSSDGIDWQSRQMLLPFSVEGPCRVKIVNNTFLLMELGDFSDAKVVFAEFNMPKTDDTLMEVATDKMFYGTGEQIKLHVRMQSNNKQTKADLYFVAAGPYNVSSQGGLLPISTTQFYYLGNDLSWHTIFDLLDAKPVVLNYALKNYSGFFMTAQAKNFTPPFQNAARYRLYSIATEAGSSLSNINPLSPLYLNDIHICDTENCAELSQ